MARSPRRVRSSADLAVALGLEEVPLEVGHRGELERSFARFSLDRPVGEDLIVGPGRRIAADQARRPLRLFRGLQDGVDRLERGQVAGAIDVDRALVLGCGRLGDGLRRICFARRGPGENLLGRRGFGRKASPRNLAKG